MSDDLSPLGPHPRNQLLRALPQREFERLKPDLRTVATPVKHLFFKHGAPVRAVYFPNDGVASVTTSLSDGTLVETATVGLEGMIGIELFFSRGAVAQGETMMQVGGSDAEELNAETFRRELERQGTFAELVGRYASATVAQMMQSAACNARHHVQERCSRWLLMTHDRVGGDEFHLSQEFLAIMLGVRRQSVTVVAGTLQHAGLITYKHGRIRILDRKGLESASCECYAVVREKLDAVTEVGPVTDRPEVVIRRTLGR